MRDERSAEITLRTLVTARWVLIGLLAGTAVLVALAPARAASFISWFPSKPNPTGFAAVLAGWSAINLATTRWGLRPGSDPTTALAGMQLVIDATVLTLLLALSGGATNPFTSVYFVPITLATQVSPRWTWSLAIYCSACFAALFLLQPIPQGPPGHEAHFAGHLRGMWVAFGASGVLITVFVHRIALSLARQREALARLQRQTLQDRHLAALGSLAAGAAHELGTPLGTVQLLVTELPHMNDAERDEAIGTVRRQLARCKSIVHRMSSPELSMQTLHAESPWELAELRDELRDDLSDDPEGVQVRFDSDVSAKTTQPRQVLGQILRELVANARDACQRAGQGAVSLQLNRSGHDIRITVVDTGPGMADEVAAQAFDPFFSTKPEGDGMGLGLYLVAAQLRQLGGDLALTTTSRSGTTMTLTFPLLAPTAAGAAV